MMAVVNSNSPSLYRRRSTSKVSADVVCCWLKTISTSRRAVHFTLSRNYPEIFGLTTPYYQVSEGLMSTSRIVRFDSISTFNVPRSPSVGLRPLSWFSIFQY